MGGMSSYLENQLMEHIFRNNYFPKPSQVAIALCTNSPSKESTGATIPEVLNGGGYLRQIVNPSDINWNIGSQGLITNKNYILFPVATTNWGTITYIAIIDNVNYGEGNMLFFGELLMPIAANSGFKVRFQPNQIQIKPDGCS